MATACYTIVFDYESPCDDVPTEWMAGRGEACADLSRATLESKCAGNVNWENAGDFYCKLSCYDAGDPYDDAVCRPDLSFTIESETDSVSLNLRALGSSSVSFCADADTGTFDHAPTSAPTPVVIGDCDEPVFTDANGATRSWRSFSVIAVGSASDEATIELASHSNYCGAATPDRLIWMDDDGGGTMGDSCANPDSGTYVGEVVNYNWQGELEITDLCEGPGCYPDEFHYSKFVALAEQVQAYDDGSKYQVVVIDQDLDRNDLTFHPCEVGCGFNGNCPTEDPVGGECLVVFTGTAPITLIRDYGGDGNKFGPSVLAPRAKVTVDSNGAFMTDFVDGVIVAKQYYSAGGSANAIQLHGDGYNGPPLTCIVPPTTPEPTTAAPTAEARRDDSRWVLGTASESCDDACAGEGLLCFEEGFFAKQSEQDSVYDITTLVATFGQTCDFTEANTWKALPLRYSTGGCAYKPAAATVDDYDCAKETNGHRRLCVCQSSLGCEPTAQPTGPTAAPTAAVADAVPSAAPSPAPTRNPSLAPSPAPTTFFPTPHPSPECGEGSTSGVHAFFFPPTVVNFKVRTSSPRRSSRTATPGPTSSRPSTWATSTTETTAGTRS